MTHVVSRQTMFNLNSEKTLITDGSGIAAGEPAAGAFNTPPLGQARLALVAGQCISCHAGEGTRRVAWGVILVPVWLGARARV